MAGDKVLGGGLTLDAGALIAIEKEDRQVAIDLRLAVRAKRRLTVPAAVLAQVWRGNHPVLARVLRDCLVETFDEARAKAVGALLAKTRTTDIVDAAVVVGATRRADVILTSDPKDIGRLVAAVPRPPRVVTV